MAFTTYRSIDDVVKKHKLVFVPGEILAPARDAPPFDDYFKSELNFTLHNLRAGRSEIGSSELILFPILREVWKSYVDEIALFTHEPLRYDDDLTGVPDYFICRKSKYGQTIPEVPFLLIVEAKLDDFEKAWGQCPAQMLAAKKLNGTPDMPVYGMATNGNAWQFGRLVGRVFAQDPSAIALATLEPLNQQMHAYMRACQALAAQYEQPVTTP